MTAAVASSGQSTIPLPHTGVRIRRRNTEKFGANAAEDIGVGDAVALEGQPGAGKSTVRKRAVFYGQ